jgi:hypothetical protein
MVMEFEQLRQKKSIVVSVDSTILALFVIGPLDDAEVDAETSLAD